MSHCVNSKLKKLNFWIFKIKIKKKNSLWGNYVNVVKKSSYLKKFRKETKNLYKNKVLPDMQTAYPEAKQINDEVKCSPRQFFMKVKKNLKRYL